MILYYRAIVCLANSRKYRGKCVAGKYISNYVWVRPVANTDTGELVLDQIRYEDGSIPKVLDIIRVPLKQRHPKLFQPENVFIRSGMWEKVGIFLENKLDNLCDNPPTLWVNNQPSKDRISYEFLEENNVESSLLFIKPTAVRIKCEDRKTDYGEKKRILRALFTYNRIHYDLRVTDPYIENKYRKINSGTYPLTADNIYMCISLGEPYLGNCYKLIASIITVEEKPSESILLEPEEKQTLFEKLKKWRTKQAKKEDVPPYVVAHDRSLKEVIDLNIKSIEDLPLVYGFGEKKVDKYGHDILNIMKTFFEMQETDDCDSDTE